MFDKDKLKKAIDLFLVSFLALYFEILLIRWIPSSVQIVAYFTNVILISSFLGLGLGCLLIDLKFDLFCVFPFLMFTMVALMSGFNNVEVKAAFLKNEYLLGFYGTQGLNFIFVIIIIFIFNTLLFIPLGQRLGIGLKNFKPLVAYSINILGSIIGIAAFSLISYLMLEPFQWFLIGFLFMMWFFVSSRRQFWLQLMICVFSLLIISGTNVGAAWSPYYKVEIFPYASNMTKRPIGLHISVNNTHHQYAFNLTDKSVAVLPELTHYKEIYEFPYHFIQPKRVAILGAGSGNDASAAIRMGVSEVYAVDIDPFIASLGKTMHPERPYLSKNLNLIVDDARSFIRRTDKKFDLVTFGYLDAHKVLSQFSSVRLDNFIYTKESFSDIKNHLSQEGLVSLTYLVFREWVAAKLYVAMREVFNQDLLVFRTTTYNTLDTAIFLAGPGVKNIKNTDFPGFRLYDGFDKRALPINDNWPYLYLMDRSIPAHYLIIILLILALSLFAVNFISSVPFQKFNSHFFFLGAGFMLIEAVSITRFALLFGSTWLVNSVVITSILVMALLANLYVVKAKKINTRAIYALLISSIFINWLLSPNFYLNFGRSISIVLPSVILSLPLFFAGIIFADSFKKTKDVSRVFAYNLLGAILGGVIEYVSMLSGFSFLLFLAITMYFLSYVGLHKKFSH